jgi:hypothetical protein
LQSNSCQSYNLIGCIEQKIMLDKCSLVSFAIIRCCLRLQIWLKTW